MLMIGCSPCSDPAIEAYEPRIAVGKVKSQWWTLIQYVIPFQTGHTRVSNISSGADYSDHLRELGDEFTRSPTEGS